MTDIQAIRGMNDILPMESTRWRLVEKKLIDCVSQYGYQEIRLPLVESTQLFKRTIGEVTDIIEKEMYTFTDLNNESISLRPEGTAGTVRACLEHGLLYHQIQRLWYLGPMFRYEKPQKGRSRQFNHFGLEVFGITGVAIELELLSICMRIWKAFKIDTSVRLEINTLGTLEERQLYRSTLVDYFTQHHALLDEDSKRRLNKNPLRILDSKNPDMQNMIAAAPSLLASLGNESRAHFEQLCDGLNFLGIPYIYNPRLVRGLDYYGHTVFEWVTDYLGSQATLCAGGRYDALVSQLGGQPTPAVGFAMGIERLLLILEALDYTWPNAKPPAVFMIVDSLPLAQVTALKLAEEIRTELGVDIIVNVAGGGFKSQFKKADKSGAQLACIIGESELETNTVGIKFLRENIAQLTLRRDEVLTKIADYIASN